MHRRIPATPRVLVGALVWALATFGAIEVGAHPGLDRDVERATEAIAQDPENAALYANRAYYLRLGEHLDESLADLEKGYELEPANQAVAVGLGLTLSAMGRDAEAEAALTRFLGAGGRSVPAYAGRAAIRARAGKFEEAIQDYTAALEIQRDVELYLARGALQEATGDLDAAAAGYHDGFETLGGAVTLRLALIRVETGRGNYDSALGLVDEELQRVPVKTTWLLRKSEVLRAAGETEDADRTLNQALTEANQMIEKRATGIQLLSRAKVYMAMGRRDLAREDLEVVLQKSPRFAEARELLEQLEAHDILQED